MYKDKQKTAYSDIMVKVFEKQQKDKERKKYQAALGKNFAAIPRNKSPRGKHIEYDGFFEQNNGNITFA